MNNYSLELPTELLDQAQRLASEKRLSLEQWFLLAISEKVNAEQSFELMRSYAAQVDYPAFDEMMSRVPDVDPMPGDEL
jgi:hypothetical protein